jgi:hypothetical protein
VSFQRNALKTQGTHAVRSLHLAVLRAGQRSWNGTNRLPRIPAKNPVGGTVRVAEGEDMSTKKTSTAALDSFRHALSATSGAFRATRPVHNISCLDSPSREELIARDIRN